MTNFCNYLIFKLFQSKKTLEKLFFFKQLRYLIIFLDCL